MKPFKPTYLYVKTHNVTGLRYFGKTVGDPYSYSGSGKHWLRHLRKHGNDVTTEVIGYFLCPEECEKEALTFSHDNQIVESPQWANMIVENGLDGGATGRTNYPPMTEETRKRLSKSLRGRVPWNKGKKGVTPGNRKPRTEEQKAKLRETNLGKKLSQETRKKMSRARKGKPRPEAIEWLKGREVSEETRRKISESNKGKKRSDETRERIRQARANQTFSDETREKLKGKVPVVDPDGNILRIDRDLYYNQEGDGDERQYVHHNTKEGRRRKDIARMRR